MQTTIKAIPTKYKGVEFRSRLEARWAVFYDALGIKYLYEHEGYQLPSGWYLPDFFLPDIDDGCFTEIKPVEPSDTECAFARELIEATGNACYIFQGLVRYPGECEGSYAWLNGFDFPYCWCECPKCHRLGITFEGRGASVCGDRCCPNENKLYTHYAPRFLEAYRRAQTFRFW